MRVASSDTQEVTDLAPRAATQHTIGANIYEIRYNTGYIAARKGILFWAFRVEMRVIFIKTPLRDISRHIVQIVAGGGIAANGSSMSITILRIFIQIIVCPIRASSIGGLVAPWIFLSF